MKIGDRVVIVTGPYDGEAGEIVNTGVKMEGPLKSQKLEYFSVRLRNGVFLKEIGVDCFKLQEVKKFTQFEHVLH